MPTEPQELKDALDRWDHAETFDEMVNMTPIVEAARRVMDLEKKGLLSGVCDVWPVCSNCAALLRFGE